MAWDRTKANVIPGNNVYHIWSNNYHSPIRSAVTIGCCGFEAPLRSRISLTDAKKKGLRCCKSCRKALQSKQNALLEEARAFDNILEATAPRHCWACEHCPFDGREIDEVIADGDTEVYCELDEDYVDLYRADTCMRYEEA